MKELVRISNTDIKGGIPVFYALQRITGVSYAFSNGICRSLGIDEKKKIGLMSEQELKHVAVSYTHLTLPTTPYV